jgi:hypothetical protein
MSGGPYVLLDAEGFLPVDNGVVLRPSPIGENLGVVHYDDRYFQPGGTLPTIWGINSKDAPE